MVGSVGLALAALLLVSLPFVLAKEERGRIRLPVALFLVHLVLVAVRSVVPAEMRDADRLIVVLEVFFLFGTITRSAYLLLLHALLVRTLGREPPKIVRDLLQALLWTGVVLLTLNAAGVSPTSILTTSALLTAVVGLSLQDTLGNLFAGLALQLQAPFRVGDWIAFDDDERHWGRVVEMNWRAVKVVTLAQVEMVVPNGTLATSALTNFTAPTPAARREVTVFATPERSPEEVTAVLLGALGDAEGVVRRPAPDVLLRAFHERGIEYELRYFVEAFGRRERVDSAVRSRVWYALQRAGIEVPAPRRTVTLHEVTEETREHEAEHAVESRESALHGIDFLAHLPDAALHTLAESAETRLFAPGERIVREGDAGEELFVIRRGGVRIEIGAQHREVARIGPGQFFGEMSLMTGEERRATVRALEETELLALDRACLQPVLESQPELAQKISEVLAERRRNLDANAVMDAAKSYADQSRESLLILDRIKKFFSLGGD